MTKDNTKQRHDPKEALRLIKAEHLNRNVMVAEDADDEARELVNRENADRSRRRNYEAMRLADGRYFIAEAASSLASQQCMDVEGRDQLCRDMARCAALPNTNKHKLIVRDPRTQVPIPDGEKVGLACTVYSTDVNTWLDAIGARYRWDVEMRVTQIARREKATTLQDDAIIAALIARKIDPLQMPSAPLGNKPWALREEVGRELKLSSVSMKKAFTRLRKANRMKSA
jgi:hypothetical protein